MERNAPPGALDSMRVLLVEDNPADALLLKRTLRQSGLPHRLVTVEDGVEALHFLHRQHPYTAAKTPDLVLLDLNLPRKSGMEVLAEIKRDPVLKIIPVIILTSSESPEDIVSSYALGANSYLRKSMSLDDTFDLLQTVQQFWMRAAVLPTRVAAL